MIFRPVLRICFSLPHRQRLPRRLHPLASIILRNVQYVHMEGRHLVVVDVALALVMQAMQNKPGSHSALLSQARSLEDEAMSDYGALMPVGSVLSLPPGVRPLPAPLADPPFGATAALDRSADGATNHSRCVLAYTAGGLAWLLGAVRCCGDPRLLSAMEAVARSGIVDRIGACLDLLPEAPTGPIKPRRAAATVAILLVCDKTDNAAAAAATGKDSCESDGASGDDGSEDDDNRGDDDHSDHKDLCTNDTSGYGDSRSVPVAAAAMRNELPGVDPWAVVGCRDRLAAVGASAREACALLSATAACLVRNSASACLYVDAALIVPIDDAGFRHALDVAFGLASP
ncbi:hypothetical protein pmac_cds_800 [Pandoravirus macleodensis]|uniref:Uncharacterized protein n=1 Tax=Pandoravirus macleodensis TaxID=2107707 RepID=A0A2U7UG54_9VIRU|nr:hypothetical protein pmac_cds_800 [Pandoravirus macleodensis]AVK77488.1 hypothetical protein pmac_cds_800 [Pandoravirus macleodensis]